MEESGNEITEMTDLGRREVKGGCHRTIDAAYARLLAL